MYISLHYFLWCKLFKSANILFFTLYFYLTISNSFKWLLSSSSGNFCYKELFISSRVWLFWLNSGQENIV